MAALLTQAAFEARVLTLIDVVVEERSRIEDGRFECKSVWPEANKSARQLAGLANAARLNPVAWIVGLDEDGHRVVPLEDTELADWWPSVRRCFDSEVAPEVIYNLNIPSKHGPVCGLYFDTSRAPFVVKNSQGGSIQREVPWRELNSTRSAHRHELLRLLVTVSSAPMVQPLSVSAHLAYSLTDAKDPIHVGIKGALFFDVPGRAAVAIPEHVVQGTLEFGPGGPSGVDPPELAIGGFEFYMPTLRVGSDLVGRQSVPMTGHPLGVDVVNDVLYLSGPGKVYFRAYVKLPRAYTAALKEWPAADMRIHMQAFGADATVSAHAHLGAVTAEHLLDNWYSRTWTQE